MAVSMAVKATAIGATLAVGLSLPCTAAAETIQHTGAHLTRRQMAMIQLIRKAARETLSRAATIQIGPTEAVNSVHACRQYPEVHFYGNGSYRDARVSCPGRGWQFYIPVTLTQKQAVIVAAHAIPSNQTLTRADLKVIRESGLGQQDLAHSLNAVLGQTLRAPVSKGTPISLDALQGATKVHAGQSLTVRVRSGLVVIKTTAIALQDGRSGQSILVKNPSSGKRYRVTVTPSGGAAYNLGS